MTRHGRPHLSTRRPHPPLAAAPTHTRGARHLLSLSLLVCTACRCCCRPPTATVAPPHSFHTLCHPHPHSRPGPRRLDTDTNELVAVKIINLEEAEEEIEEIRQEITMLSECQSPYVTRYITSYTSGPDLCIAMEYLGGGSVHDLLEAAPLEESFVAIITRELLKACDYLHSNGKIHRDIK